MNKKPKILLWDIETSHNILAGFDLAWNGVPVGNILQDWYMISAAWRWYGQKRTYGVTALDYPELFAKDHTDDYWIINQLYGTISEADAIVAHYGDNFDVKKLNTRMIQQGFGPLPPVIQLDTWKMAKAKFKFTSNKLDYIAKYLGHEGKMETPTGLWLRCLDGEKKAIREMLAYNKQDVDVLEFVFEKLVPAKVNERLFNSRAQCPSCGGEHINYHGYVYTKQRKYRRFQCLDCGNWDRERQAVKE